MKPNTATQKDLDELSLDFKPKTRHGKTQRQRRFRLERRGQFKDKT